MGASVTSFKCKLIEDKENLEQNAFQKLLQISNKKQTSNPFTSNDITGETPQKSKKRPSSSKRRNIFRTKAEIITDKKCLGESYAQHKTPQQYQIEKEVVVVAENSPFFSNLPQKKGMKDSQELVTDSGEFFMEPRTQFGPDHYQDRPIYIHKAESFEDGNQYTLNPQLDSQFTLKGEFNPNDGRVRTSPIQLCKNFGGSPSQASPTSNMEYSEIMEKGPSHWNLGDSDQSQMVKTQKQAFYKVGKQPIMVSETMQTSNHGPSFKNDMNQSYENDSFNQLIQKATQFASTTKKNKYPRSESTYQ